MKFFRSSLAFFLALVLLVNSFAQAQTTTTTTTTVSTAKPKGMSKTLKGGLLGGLSRCKCLSDPSVALRQRIDTRLNLQPQRCSLVACCCK